jgi:uncharacterized coiled-coil protein SlyX
MPPQPQQHSTTSTPSPSNPGQPTDTTELRLQSIEAAIAFLQHDVDSLNQSILTCLHKLQEFNERFTRIEHELITFQQQPERRDPAAERPPHY